MAYVGMALCCMFCSFFQLVAAAAVSLHRKNGCQYHDGLSSMSIRQTITTSTSKHPTAFVVPRNNREQMHGSNELSNFLNFRRRSTTSQPLLENRYLYPHRSSIIRVPALSAKAKVKSDNNRPTTKGSNNNNNSSNNNILKVISKARSINEIDHFIKGVVIQHGANANSMTPKEETQLIELLGRRRAYDSILAFVGNNSDNRQQGRNRKRSVFAYTAAIKALAQSSIQRYRKKALRVLDYMDEMQVEPNSYTITALFSSVDGAKATMDLLNRVRQYEHLKLGIHVYNAAIHACSRIPRGSSPKFRSNKSSSKKFGTDWQTALKIFYQMRQQGVKPTRQTYGCLLNACAQSGQVRIALSLLREMQNVPGLEPNAKVWGAALNACAKAGDYMEAMKLMAEMQQIAAAATTKSNDNKVVKPNLKHYTAFLSALAKAGEDQLALQFLKGMQGDSEVTISVNETTLVISPIPPDLVALNTVLASCAKAHNYDAAKTLLERMKAGEFTVSASSPSRRSNMGLTSNRRNPNEEIIRPDVISYNSAMSACQNSQQARALVKEMRLSRRHRHGAIPPTSVTYVNAIKACRNGGIPDMESVRFLLDTASDDGLPPNVFMYSAAIWTAECGGDYQTALAFLDEMKSFSNTDCPCPPNAISYDGVISSLASNGLAFEAIDLFEEMKEAGITPTPITFQRLAMAVSTESSLQRLVFAINTETLLENHISIENNSNRISKQIDELERIVDLMDVSDLRPGIPIIEALICAYGSESNGYNEAKRVYKATEALVDGGLLDAGCVRAMLYACAKATPAKWEDAISILHSSDILPGSTGPAKIDTRALSYAVLACCKETQFEEALNLLRLYGGPRKKGSSVISLSAINALISACGRGGRPDISLKILNEMESVYGVMPNRRSYRCAMIVCNQAEHERRRHMRRRHGRELSLENGKSAKRPSEALLDNSDFTDDSDFQWWECALSLLRRMEEAGLTPDSQIYSSAISACEAAGQWQRALGVLRSMMKTETLGEASPPNLYCFNAAISACEKGGAWLEALELYERMQEDGGAVKPNFISLNSLLVALDKAGQRELAQSKYDEGRLNKIVSPWKKSTSSDGTSIRAMDLHNFSGAMAKAAIRSLMEHFLSSDRPVHDTSKDLIIIVGKGKGSENNRVVLLPTVRRLLAEDYGIEVEIDPSNSGRLVLESHALQSVVQSRKWR